jgi:hypothetical protein
MSTGRCDDEDGIRCRLQGAVKFRDVAGTPRIDNLRSGIHGKRWACWSNLWIEWGQRLAGTVCRPSLVGSEVERKEGTKLGGRLGRVGERVGELGTGAKTILGRRYVRRFGKHAGWKGRLAKLIKQVGIGRGKGRRTVTVGE